MSSQPKHHSIIEQTLNIASGFLISLFVWAYVVKVLIDKGWITIDDNLIIVSIFTVTSFIRGLFWRRLFNWWQHHRGSNV